jgi:hypothetical protein
LIARSPRLAAVIVLSFAAIIALCTGCNVPTGIAQVSGVVLLDGRPLEGAVVTFQPRRASLAAEKYGGSVGHTDEAGRFTLRLIEPDAPGVAIGEHVVTITTARSGPNDAIPPRGERAPFAWRNGSQTFHVPAGGTTSARFDMQSR